MYAWSDPLLPASVRRPSSRGADAPKFHPPSPGPDFPALPVLDPSMVAGDRPSAAVPEGRRRGGEAQMFQYHSKRNHRDGFGLFVTRKRTQVIDQLI